MWLSVWCHQFYIYIYSLYKRYIGCTGDICRQSADQEQSVEPGSSEAQAKGHCQRGDKLMFLIVKSSVSVFHFILMFNHSESYKPRGKPVCIFGTRFSQGKKINMTNCREINCNTIAYTLLSATIMNVTFSKPI